MGRTVRRLCTICARGGSKGVPRKNIREIAGKPLIAHSILQAKRSRLFQGVAVSSDSKEILEKARVWGADFLILRPASLARDTTPKMPVLKHCVMKTEEMVGRCYETVVDLDVSSPLRTPDDIRQCVRLLEERGVTNVITGVPARRSPYFNVVRVYKNGSVRPVVPLKKTPVRRQDAPVCYDMNASVYAWCREKLMRSDTVFNQDTLLYVMPPERSVDIDAELDFKIVDFLMHRRQAP